MISINGHTQTYKQISVQKLLEELDLASSVCAIEVNNKLVPHKDRGEHIVQDGDSIEIVSLVGGG